MSISVRWAVSGPDFESFLNRHRHQLAMVHFWADWNPVDPGMFEVFDEIHEAVGTEVALARVQVGPPENQELCQWLGILQVPTVMYIFRNRVIDSRVGYSKNRLVGHVQMLLNHCRFAGTEPVMNLPLPPNEDTGYSGPSLSSPGFGSVNASLGMPGVRTGGQMPSGLPQEPQRRFGLEVVPPTTPVVAERQNKSWLSRWLSVE
jgi:thiol-disulfide isomerase/thioredoxin